MFTFSIQPTQEPELLTVAETQVGDVLYSTYTGYNYLRGADGLFNLNKPADSFLIQPGNNEFWGRRFRRLPKGTTVTITVL